MNFGQKVPASTYRPQRDLIAEPETAAIGNVCLRIGRELAPEAIPEGSVFREGDWSQHGYVVLEPDEAMELANTLIDLVTGKIPQVRREKFAKDKQIAREEADLGPDLGGSPMRFGG